MGYMGVAIPDGGVGMSQAERIRFINQAKARQAALNAPPAPPPLVNPGGGLNAPPRVRSVPQQTGPSAADIAAANAAAETAKAKKAGKDQTAKENAATQSIIDTLLKTLGGYAQGRDTANANAQTTLDTTLEGILANYQAALTDYEASAATNTQDESSKSAANVVNRARERMGNLAQVLSQGGGETDALRALLTVFQNYDANQLDVTRSFFDTERGINSQIAGANSQAATNRQSAWQQYQEARGQAENDYRKNYMDVWTNAQRTGAQNTNVESDYSTGFTANYGGKNPEEEAARYAGQQYTQEDKDEKWYREFEGKKEGKTSTVTSTNRAGSATIKAPKAAEGATLRNKS
jgi:hypothetical protein